MTDAKQYALILKKCGGISEDLKKLKTDIHALQAVSGAMVAELNAVKERIDLYVNQDFFLKGLKEKQKQDDIKQESVDAVKFSRN